MDVSGSLLEVQCSEEDQFCNHISKCLTFNRNTDESLLLEKDKNSGSCLQMLLIKAFC